jgi:hypothetical protein
MCTWTLLENGFRLVVAEVATKKSQVCEKNSITPSFWVNFKANNYILQCLAFSPKELAIFENQEN